jgi:hypothetical protein
MQAKVDELCVERARQVREQRVKYPGTDKVIRKCPQSNLSVALMI